MKTRQNETDQLGKHTILRYDPDKSTGVWKPSSLQPGQTFQKPTPLFKKLEPTIVAEELERIRK